MRWPEVYQIIEDNFRLMSLEVDDSPHLWWGKCPPSDRRTVVQQEHLC